MFYWLVFEKLEYFSPQASRNTQIEFICRTPYIGLYSICKRKQPNDISLTVKAMANASFLLVLSITVARIFLIEPFFDDWLEPFLILRGFLFIFGVVCLFGLELSFQNKIYKETGVFSHGLINTIFGKKVK